MGPVEEEARGLGIAVRGAQALVAVVALLAALGFAYIAVFTQFAYYDDEGYVMASVRSFLAGSPLFDRTYTQYGPAYYLAKRIFFGLAGGPVTHDLTRIATLGCWLGSAALIALFVRIQTGSINWALATFVQVVLYLKALANEPGHPQELLVLLLAAALAVAALRPGRAAGMALLGILVGLTVLTKINAGVYMGLSLGLAFLALGPRLPPERIAFRALAVAAVLLPWVVMRAHLGDWAFEYALLVSLAAAAFALVGHQGEPEEPLARGGIGIAALAAAATALALVGWTLARGTSPSGLLEGLVLRPLSFATVFPVAWEFTPTAGVLGLVGLGLAARHARRTGPGSPDDAEGAGLGLRLLVGALVGIVIAKQGSPRLAWICPFAWILLVPAAPGEQRLERRFPAAVLGALAVLQPLIAYPVAGSQKTWATLLAIPVAVLCLAALTSAMHRRMPRRLGLLAEALGLAMIFDRYAPQFEVRAMARRYFDAVPLGLPGSSHLRLPPEQAKLYREIAREVGTECGTLVGLPGFNSMSFWSGVPPPTDANPGAWMILLDDATQQEIVDRLVEEPRACVLRNESAVDFWTQGRDVGGQPLVRLIRERFRTVRHFGEYELMLPVDRKR